MTLGIVIVGVLIASAIAANAPHAASLHWVRDAGQIAYAVALILAAILGVDLLRRTIQRNRDPRRARSRL